MDATTALTDCRGSRKGRVGSRDSGSPTAEMICSGVGKHLFNPAISDSYGAPAASANRDKCLRAAATEICCPTNARTSISS